MTDIKNKQCPFCGEYIPVDSLKCEFCNEDLPHEEVAEEKANIEEQEEFIEETDNPAEYVESLVQKRFDNEEKTNNKFKLIMTLLIAAVVGVAVTMGVLYKIHSGIDVSFNTDNSQKPSIVKKAIGSSANIDKAKKLYNDKELEKAAALFQEEIDKNDNPVANYYMGEIYNDQSFTKIAIEYYKQADRNKKDFFEPKKRLAQVYYGRGEYDQAESYGEKALKINPNDLELLKTMTEVYEEQDETDKLLSAYKTIIKLEPKAKDANEYLAMYYYKRDDYKTAAVYINNILNIEYDTDIAYALVNCYVKVEYYTKAISVLDKIIAKDSYESYRASNIKSYVEDLRDGYNVSHGRVPIPTSMDDDYDD